MSKKSGVSLLAKSLFQSNPSEEKVDAKNLIITETNARFNDLNIGLLVIYSILYILFE